MAPTLILLLSLAAAGEETPKIQIESPVGGWTTARIITLRGTATNAAALGTLNVNGVERPLPLKGGRFEATFALARGENAIEVLAPAKKGSQVARDRLILHAQVPRVDLQVVLYWDTDRTDVDLHLVEPSGEVVNYTNKQSKAGGRLDRDDVDGYGPEIYSLGTAPAGKYVIKAHYFGDRGTGQTTATVSVMAREGTAEERRWRYVTPLVRQGEEVILSEIDLPAPGWAWSRESTKDQNVKTRIRDSALPHSHSAGQGHVGH